MRFIPVKDAPTLKEFVKNARAQWPVNHPELSKTRGRRPETEPVIKALFEIFQTIRSGTFMEAELVRIVKAHIGGGELHIDTIRDTIRLLAQVLNFRLKNSFPLTMEAVGRFILRPHTAEDLQRLQIPLCEAIKGRRDYRRRVEKAALAVVGVPSKAKRISKEMLDCSPRQSVIRRESQISDEELSSCLAAFFQRSPESDS